MTKSLSKKLKTLPTTPGVYQFLDRHGKVIYVGKASVLRDRVRSYFRPSTAQTPAKEIMIREVRDIRAVETQSEIEALLLEATSIKKYQPRFNVIMRDDKSYVYIKVSTEEEWPRVFATRTLDKSGTYFGPFTSSYAVKETLRVLRKIIPYRCNQKPIDIQRTGLRTTEARPPRIRACLWYHLSRCPGTCIGVISKTAYRKNIRRIILFLEGKMDALRRALVKELGPTRAALMDNVLEHTRIVSLGEKFSYDATALARVLHLPRPPERIEGYDISNIMGREATGSMVVFVNGEPAKSEYKRFKIKTVRGSDDVKMLQEILERRLRHSFKNPNDECRNPNQIRNLKPDIRDLDRWPLPDLMIVDGGKAQLNAAGRILRKFDDQQTPNKKNNCLYFGPIGPKYRHHIPDIPVIAVAKGGHGGVLKQKEEIYFPGERAPLKLPNSSPALHLILRVRDEAHRFAIGYHRYLRHRRILTSPHPSPFRRG